MAKHYCGGVRHVVSWPDSARTQAESYCRPWITLTHRHRSPTHSHAESVLTLWRKCLFSGSPASSLVISWLGFCRKQICCSPRGGQMSEQKKRMLAMRGPKEGIGESEQITSWGWRGENEGFSKTFTLKFLAPRCLHFFLDSGPSPIHSLSASSRNQWVTG